MSKGKTTKEDYRADGFRLQSDGSLRRAIVAFNFKMGGFEEIG